MKYRATLAFVTLLLGYAVATTAESLAQEAAEESQAQPTPESQVERQKPAD